MRINAKLFEEIMKKSVAVHSPNLILRYIKEEEGILRFAATAPKKIAGTAVLRNKIKRRLYSAVRPLLQRVRLGYSIVLIAKANTEKIPFADLKKEVEQIFVKSALLK